jgi:predicted signal transduction protein with EAL and GGDEF domain
LARWTQLITRTRKKVLAPAARREHDEAVLELPAFTASAGRAIADGDGRGMVVVSIGVDGLGLDGGGQALMVAAETRVVRAVRPGDVVGRIGEGRLAVLAGPDEGPDGAARIAERVADRLAEPFHIAGRQVAPALRIGVANADGEGVEQLLRRAEESAAVVRKERA